MPLHHLPVRSLSAAANMAVDTLLLEAYPQPDAPRFRHYGWASPAFTFGRTQNWEAARRLLPVHASWQDAHRRFAEAFALVRRPTGGGVVDHRNDWTYALVIPATHPLAHAPARSVYRDCHLVLIGALAAQGIAARLAPCPQESACAVGNAATGQSAADGVVSAKKNPQMASAELGACRDSAVRDGAKNAPLPELFAAEKAADLAQSCRAEVQPEQSFAADKVPELAQLRQEQASAASVCFVRAEPYDIITEDGEKLAGAAQKRNRHGLLVQGSLDRTLAGGIDWQRFECDVVAGFAQWLVATGSSLHNLPQSLPHNLPQPLVEGDLSQPAAACVVPRLLHEQVPPLVAVTAFPKWSPQQLEAEIERYTSEVWNRRR